jgi:hypothetical protein
MDRCEMSFYFKNQYMGMGILLTSKKLLPFSGEAKIDGPVDIEGVNPRLLDDGMLWQSVGIFPKLTANKAKTQTRVAVNTSAEIATRKHPQECRNGILVHQGCRKVAETISQISRLQVSIILNQMGWDCKLT